MCLVIDTNTFSSVFDVDTKEHRRFAPVLDWLINGDGKMIFGGKKYKKEVAGGKYRGIIAEVEKSGKLVRVSDVQVDKICLELKKKVPEKTFDDEHLVALVIVSKCCVICTDDKKAMPYIKRRDLYPKGVKRPKIYNLARHHAPLCTSKYVVDVCR